MKAYTDLEQSKELEKILPIESADMHYSKDFDGSWFVYLAKYTSVKIPKYVGNIEEHLLPCWSLAALYSILPEQTDIFKSYSDNGEDTVVHWWNYTTDIETEEYDNPVDACVEMIIKLNELNLL